ncbi:MAG TPA: hypothetical protein PLU22_05220 [Polyangiaceae bacterium]|nr:hypothetical protein [Polyangiaceae bacterium]
MAIKKTRSKKPAKKSPAPKKAKKPAPPASTGGKGKKQTKTAFVLSFAHDVPAKVVVERGKEEGIALTERAVYKTRYLAKRRAKKSAKKAAVTAAPAAPTPAVLKGKRGPRDGRATALIRSTPLEVKASALVASAKAQGIPLSAGLVYAVRGQMKRSGKAGGAPAAAKKAAVAVTRSVVAPVGDRERQLISLAVDLGLSRAIELIEGMRAKVKAMI